MNSHNTDAKVLLGKCDFCKSCSCCNLASNCNMTNIMRKDQNPIQESSLDMTSDNIFQNDETLNQTMFPENTGDNDYEKKKHNDRLPKIQNLLIDWMAIVCKRTKQNDWTFFRTIELFDKVLNLYHNKLENEQMHLMMIACLYIASKLEEVKPLGIEPIVIDIGHYEYSKEEIFAAESLILSKLQYRIPRNSSLDFFYVIIQKIFSNSNCIVKNKIFSFSKLFYKLLFTSSNTIKNTSRISIYSGILYYSIFYLSGSLQFNKNEKLNDLIKSVKSYSPKAIDVLNVFSEIDKLNQQEHLENFPFIFEEFQEFSQ